jgi:hypothetical protein
MQIQAGRKVEALCHRNRRILGLLPTLEPCITPVVALQENTTISVC